MGRFENLDERLDDVEKQILDINTVLAHLLTPTLVGKRVRVSVCMSLRKYQGVIEEVTGKGVRVVFTDSVRSDYFGKPDHTETTVTLAEALNGLLP